MTHTPSFRRLRVQLKHLIIIALSLPLALTAAYLTAGNNPSNNNSILIPVKNDAVNRPLQTALPAKTNGQNLSDCLAKLTDQGAGWCEIRINKHHPSISSVWPKNLDEKTKMNTGPASVLLAWNSAAFDRKNRILYFFGGGHADYGGNEVYRFELDNGKWRRLTDPSTLDHLFVATDYHKRPKKPWRRLCWAPDTRRLPGSTHTYDGLIFSHTTKTLFLYNMGAANGSCFEDKGDIYKNKPTVIGPGYTAKGWYEFNPSTRERTNGLSPLSWRKVFNSEQLSEISIHQGYPVSVELKNGQIVFGSRYRTAIYDPANPSPNTLKTFSHQADWGDGTQEYDPQREVVWSLHRLILLAFDAKNGQPIKKIDAKVAHEKSLAIDKNGHIFSWNGKSKVYSLDPDKLTPAWGKIDWGEKGPQAGDGRIYGKWIYLPAFDVFVGLSSHKTGVWVYKHLDLQ
jgi:hypothetical protein